MKNIVGGFACVAAIACGDEEPVSCGCTGSGSCETNGDQTEVSCKCDNGDVIAEETATCPN